VWWLVVVPTVVTRDLNRSIKLKIENQSINQSINQSNQINQGRGTLLGTISVSECVMILTIGSPTLLGYRPQPMDPKRALLMVTFHAPSKDTGIS
jgi:hypothetical protein